MTRRRIHHSSIQPVASPPLALAVVQSRRTHSLPTASTVFPSARDAVVAPIASRRPPSRGQRKKPACAPSANRSSRPSAAHGDASRSHGARGTSRRTARDASIDRARVRAPRARRRDDQDLDLADDADDDDDALDARAGAERVRRLARSRGAMDIVDDGNASGERASGARRDTDAGSVPDHVQRRDREVARGDRGRSARGRRVGGRGDG